ncbi:DUF2141 domain-containing protein [Salinarimonas chemoclinalis]|uniref:DUF2141 domain-containing protein n=1 Tax=Salinarimonas chemoclinalis TaxID=3241599 RepID=UPI0035567C57
MTLRIALLCAALLAAALLAAAPTHASAASLVVRVSGVAVGQGPVFVGLCDRALDRETCPIGEFKRASGSTLSFRFDGVRPGRWAVAAYQDLNRNGVLDTQPILLWQLPSEPYGFSNDVGRFSPPTFDGAAFELPASGGTVSVRLARLPLDDEDAVQQAIERQSR